MTIWSVEGAVATRWVPAGAARDAGCGKFAVRPEVRTEAKIALVATRVRSSL